MLVHWDRKVNRVYIANQRLHHGPPGILAGLLLLSIGHKHWRLLGGAILNWGLSDLHDLPLWFRRETWDLNMDFKRQINKS